MIVRFVSWEQQRSIYLNRCCMAFTYVTVCFVKSSSGSQISPSLPSSICVCVDTCRLAKGEPFGRNLLLPREINGGSGGNCVSFANPLPDPTDERETVEGLLAILVRLSSDCSAGH